MSEKKNSSAKKDPEKSGENPEQGHGTGETTGTTSQTGTLTEEQTSGDDHSCTGNSVNEEVTEEYTEEEYEDEDEEEHEEEESSVVETEPDLQQQTNQLKQVLNLQPNSGKGSESGQQPTAEAAMEVDEHTGTTSGGAEKARPQVRAVQPTAEQERRKAVADKVAEQEKERIKMEQSMRFRERMEGICGEAARDPIREKFKERMDKIFGPFGGGDRVQGSSGPENLNITKGKDRSKDREDQQIDDSIELIKDMGDNFSMKDMVKVTQDTLKVGPKHQSGKGPGDRGGRKGGRSARQTPREKTPAPQRQQSEGDVFQNRFYCDICERWGWHPTERCRTRGEMFKAAEAATKAAEAAAKAMIEQAANDARREVLARAKVKVKERQLAEARRAERQHTTSTSSTFGGSQGDRKRPATDQAFSRQGSREVPKRRQQESDTQSDLTQQYAAAQEMEERVDEEARAMGAPGTSSGKPAISQQARDKIMAELVNRFAAGEVGLLPFISSAPSSALVDMLGPTERSGLFVPVAAQQRNTFGLSGPGPVPSDREESSGDARATPSGRGSSRDSSRSTQRGRPSQRARGRGGRQAEPCRPPKDFGKREDSPPPGAGMIRCGLTRGAGYVPKPSVSSRSVGQSGQSQQSSSGSGKDKPVQQGELTRQRALGFDAEMDLAYSMPENYEPTTRYYIGKRVGDMAVGILADPKPKVATEHFPLFMQFGHAERPDGAQGLVVGDIVMVMQFTRLLKPGGVPREFQPGNSNPRNYFLSQQQHIIVPSCLALKFRKSGPSRLMQIREIAALTMVGTPNPSGDKFRWTAEFASMHFQKGGKAKNAHILDGSFPGGFRNPPVPGQYAWINAYGTQKNQTLFIGDLNVPATWSDFADYAENGECVLMWMERLPQDILKTVEENKGLGNGEHTPFSFRRDFETVKMANTAAAAGERQKYVHEMRRVKMPGEISSIGNNRSYTFVPTWAKPVDRDVAACVKHLQPGSMAKLERKVGEKWESMFPVVTLAVVAPEGRIRHVRFRRVVERFGRREDARPPGEDQDGNPSVHQLERSMADLLRRDEEEEREPTEDGELPAEEETVTKEEEERWLNFKWPHHEGLRMTIDEQATGVEERISLLASCPLPQLVDEAWAGGFQSMRTELLCTLIPTSDVMSSLEITYANRDAPRSLGDCPKYHEPPKDYSKDKDGIPVMVPPDEEGQLAYLERCIPMWELGRNIRDRIPHRRALGEDQESNMEQKLIAYATVYGLHPGIFVQAPAGSDKTRLLGIIAQHMERSRPEEKILGVAQTNLAAMHLAEEICRAKGLLDSSDRTIPTVLAVQSTHSMISEHAREYGPRMNQALLNRIGVVAHVRELIRRRENDELPPEMMTEAQLESCQRYVSNKMEHPGDLTDDDKMTRFVLMRQRDINVVVCTVAKAQQLTKLLDEIKLLMVDECQMVRMVDVQNLIWATNIDQLVAAGDIHQLPPYVQHDWMDIDRFKFTMHSVAEFFNRWLDNKTMSLKKVYRFHREMVPVISYAFYAETVEHGLGAVNARTMVVDHQIPVISRNLPISLIHLTNRESSAVGTSWSNTEQEQVAEAILRTLRKRAPEASVTVVCFYIGTARKMEDRVARLLAAEPNQDPANRKLEVRTVHSYIGQEADFVVLITTRTSSPRPRPGKTVIREFVHEAQIATVAFTRAKEAAFVIGNMDFLYEKFDQSATDPDTEPLAAVGRYVNRTSRVSPPVDGHRYRNYLEWLLTQPEGTAPVYSEHGQVLLDTRYGNLAFTANTLPGRKQNWIAGASTPGPAQQG